MAAGTQVMGYQVVNKQTPSFVTADSAANQLGAIRLWNGEKYQWMYNAGGESANAGYGVRLITGASGYSMAITAQTDTFNPCAGFVKHADIPNASYGWVMTKGFGSINLVSASTADMKMIALGSTGQFIEASGTATLGTARACGYLLSHNTGAGGSGYAFIKAFHE